MTHAVVTVEYNTKERVDLALPLNVPNHILAPAIAKSLQLEDKGSGMFLLSLRIEEGIQRLGPDATLAEAGVLDGSIMLLQRREGVSPTTPMPSKSTAALITESGERFAIELTRTVIGRRDIKRGILADIDLSPFDEKRITSRPHAALEKQEDGLYLVDLGSANGTWLNGEKLTPRQARKLQDEDELVFGRDGVKMRFEAK